jgi:flagellar protein FliJ
VSRRRVDPGLHAVARVRGLRERDSRLGLQRARADELEATAAVERLEGLLAGLDGRADGDAGEFVAVRAIYLQVGEALTEVRRDEQAAHLVALDAAVRWRSDHARLGAVEGLLERRAAARAVEARRAEDRELDDVAGRLWLRASERAVTTR